MNEFLLFHIKFSIVFIVVFTFFYFTLKKERNFSLNRYILLLMIPTIIIISTTNIVPNIGENIEWEAISTKIINNNGVEINKTDLINNKTITEKNENNLQEDFDILNLLIICYFLIGGIILLFSVYSIFVLLNKLKNAKIKYKINKNIKVVTLEENTNSYSFLKWIVVPNNLSKEEETIIIKHEMAHVEHMHSIDILLKVLIYSVFWYNPLLYVWGKCLVNIHEYQADQKAIQNKDNLLNYMKVMLKFSSMSNTNLLTSKLKSSSIKERFKMFEIMISQKSTSKGLIVFKYLTLFLLFLTMAFMISCNDASFEYNLVDTVPYHKLTKVPKRINNEINKGNNTKNHDWNYIELTDEAVENGIKSVYAVVSYNIYPDSNISDVKIYNGRVNQGEWSKKIGYGLDEKAIELVKSLGKYLPGEVNGKKVKVNMRVPIFFGDYTESEGYKSPSIISTPGSNFGNLIFVQNVDEEKYPKIKTADIIKLLKIIKYPNEAINEKKEGMVGVVLHLNKLGEIKSAETSAQKSDFGMQQAVIDGLKNFDKFDVIHNKTSLEKGGVLNFKIYFSITKDWIKDYQKLLN